MTYMRLVITAALVLAVATPASAIDFTFSWSSEVMGRGFDPAVRDFVQFRQDLSGAGTAALSSTPGHIMLDFATVGGPAHLELNRAVDFGFAENTRLPFDVPTIAGGRGVGLYPNAGAIFVSSYTFQGAPDQPTSFVIRAGQPGSTAAPEFTFVGTGRVLSAKEPGVEAVILAMLVATAVVRFRARSRAFAI